MNQTYSNTGVYICHELTFTRDLGVTNWCLVSCHFNPKDSLNIPCRADLVRSNALICDGQFCKWENSWLLGLFSQHFQCYVSLPPGFHSLGRNQLFIFMRIPCTWWVPSPLLAWPKGIEVPLISVLSKTIFCKDCIVHGHGRLFLSFCSIIVFWQIPLNTRS